MKKERIVPQCAGCGRIWGDRCIALIEPGYPWRRYGHCWAWTPDPIPPELLFLPGRRPKNMSDKLAYRT